MLKPAAEPNRTGYDIDCIRNRRYLYEYNNKNNKA
ncbi:unknown [[Eubacterium] siraeum CAG:80]|uniref:Uncharacterized protein n=1 Tax=[Eubacterium] siraeum CAG:80 TaxID=1263080 RepID=R6R6Q4_9FIRM|nr:unknown [[Eubacterium] siraeum CAG:80]